MESGSLYIVPTPIGNLGDITIRALEVLKSVDLILAEDTRTSGVLMKHYAIQTPLKSFHAHNEHQKLSQVISQLQSGESIALISDAGTPGISDPGFLLIREALAHELKLEVLPGANAFVPALLHSGFPSDRFVFEGFLPHKKGRQTRLNALKEEERTIIFYESPHRIEKLLNQLQEVFDPRRKVSVSRELTKKFEETVTGTIEEVSHHFEVKKPKGEFVVVLHGKGK